jgi:hypothetical protein
MLDEAFLDWLRATTEARWADPSLRDAASAGLGEVAWQPGTRWRGPLSASDLEIVESMFEVAMPAAYRRFLTTLHTPDPAMAATQARAGRLVRVERRLFTDWTGPTTPIIAAFERPMGGLLRGVALGRWHPSWGERPPDARERERVVRGLAAGAPRLIPFAGDHYLLTAAGADDSVIVAVHGADASTIAPDLRRGLLRELGLADPAHASRATDDGHGAAGGASAGPAASAAAGRGIRFWGDLLDGIPWLPLRDPGRG